MTTIKHVYGSAIPSISDDRIAELVARLRPVTQPDAREIVRFYRPCEPRGIAFMWGDTTEETGQVVAYVGKPFRTLHTFGAPSFFKPTLAEVFAQIPADLDIGPANAFWVRYADFQVIRPEGGDSLSGQTYHAGEVQLLVVR